MGSTLTKVHDFVVLTDSPKILLAGELLSARDGKRIRLACVQMIDFETGTVSEPVTLYEGSRLKAIDSCESNIITGDSDGVVKCWKFTEDGEKQFTELNSVSSGGRIT